MNRLLFSLATVIFFLLPVGCAAQQKEAVMYPPCVESKPTPERSLCAGLAADQCAARRAFVRRSTAGTVNVVIAYSSKENGAGLMGGTGVIIDDRGTVLTAEHVVTDALVVIVTPRELTDDFKPVRHRGILMRVAAADKALDSALLVPVGAEKLPAPMPWIDEPLTVGETVWQFGKTTTWSTGKIVANDVTIGGIPHTTQTSVYVEHGDSGGPLVDEKGRARGQLTRMSGKDQNGYFVPIGLALRTLGYIK